MFNNWCAPIPQNINKQAQSPSFLASTPSIIKKKLVFIDLDLDGDVPRRCLMYFRTVEY